MRTLTLGIVLTASAVACADPVTAPPNKFPSDVPSPAKELTVDDGATYDQIAAEILALPANTPGVRQSATGHAEPTDKSGVLLQKYSFTALRSQDGTLSGRFVVHTATAGIDVTAQGDVECLAAAALKPGVGTAGVVGRVTHTTSPVVGDFQVGSTVFWNVTDVGESAAEEDRATPMAPRRRLPGRWR